MDWIRIRDGARAPRNVPVRAARYPPPDRERSTIFSPVHTMKLSLNWLKEFLPLDQPVAEIVEALIFSGVEVEGIQQHGADFDNVIVAQIESFERHPNADRLSVCRVNDGSGLPRQIVCGAKNFSAGAKVPLALPGAILPGGVKIKASKLRGVESEGMLCSARELTLAEDGEGLLILRGDARIGKPLSELFPPDTVIEVEITPNRPDQLSHYGIARELSALLDLSPAKLPNVNVVPDQRNAAVVQLDAPDACPLYAARIIRGIQVGPSPGWLKQRLEAAGVRSINNVVDVTNYVMLEVGQPFHAFDLAKLSGGIVVRMAGPGERLLALDGKEYQLNPTDLLIADHERPVAIAGVMGGEQSGVTATTTDVLLEAAYFDPNCIRRTSRRLGLISESSFRFERGIDPGAVLFCGARAADLILQMAGGQADSYTVIGGAVPDSDRMVELRPERCEKLLGMPVPNSADLLARLGLKNIGGNRWQIPSYRPDLLREVDLVEARSLTLVDERSLEYLLEPPADPLKLRNPLSEDQRILRPSLVPGLIRATERNFNRGATSVAIFEIGRVFKVATKEESIALALVVAGERQSKTWNQAAATFDLFDLKGILNTAVSKELTLMRDQPTGFAPLLCRVVDGEGQTIGRIAQVRPGLAKELGARDPVLVAELTLDPGKAGKDFKFKALDRFPAVTRDIAFVADRGLKYQVVLDAIASAHEPLLVDVCLFDLFVDSTGEKVPADKKSIACSLTYRATDRTLAQDEANAAHGRVKSQLAERLGVTFRE